MQLLFPKEEEVMYIIWKINHPCVISEILRSDLTQKRNTVAKVLIILEKKEFIKVDSVVKTKTRTGRAYIPLISKTEYENQKMLFDYVEKSDTAQTGVLSFISKLIDSSEATESFIEKMDTLIDEYKKKVGK